MNQVIETILNHRSIRKFANKELTEEQIQTIVQAAQSASTSSFLQAYSIIGVSDAKKKEQLAQVAGNQPYVAENGHFFVFCADLYRLAQAGELEGEHIESALESKESFIVGIVDAALAAQNAALAAESLGLGICYIGGIRNNLEEVVNILQLPERVMPLFGLAVGYPAQEADKKPRLPLSHIYHENEYEQNMEQYKQQLATYDHNIQKYYEDRTGNKRHDKWTAQVVKMLAQKSREYIKHFVDSQKLDRK